MGPGRATNGGSGLGATTHPGSPAFRWLWPTPGPPSGSGPQRAAPGNYGVPQNPGYGASPTPSGGGIKGEAMTHPWLLGSLALTVTFLLVVIGDILSTFQKQKAVARHSDVLGLLALKPNVLGGRDRVLQFFDFAQPPWGLFLLLAIALLVFGPKLTGAGESTGTRRLLIEVILIADAVVAVGGVINAIIYVTLFGQSFTLGLHGFLESLGGSVIGVAAGYWALGNRTKAPRKASSAPPPPPWGPGGGAPPTTGFQPGQYPAQGGYPPPGSYGGGAS